MILIAIYALCALIVVALVVALIAVSGERNALRRRQESILSSCGSAAFLVNKKGNVVWRCNVPRGEELSRAQLLCRGTKKVSEWMDTASWRALQAAFKSVTPNQKQTLQVLLNGDSQPSLATVLKGDGGRLILLIASNASTPADIENLRNRSGLMEKIMEFMPIPVNVKDMTNRGAFLIWNKQATELFGFNPIADDGKVGFTNEFQQRLADADREALANKQSSFIAEYTAADNEKRMLHVQKRLIKRDDGRKWIITTIFDMTDLEMQRQGLQEAEANLREALKKADISSRLKSEFLSNMSHEVRTPLNGIKGFAECMVSMDSEEERQTLYREVSRCSDDLTSIIDGIILLSKIESGEMSVSVESFLLNDFLQEVVDSDAMTKNDSVTIQTQCPDQIFGINADREKVGMILKQFLSNAKKYTSEGTITIGYTTKVHSVHFFVTDTGVGMSAEDQQTAFDRFVKNGSMKHGIGLGLSICSSMASLLGGKVGVESELGKGSTFYFDLPCALFTREERTSALGKLVKR